VQDDDSTDAGSPAPSARLASVTLDETSLAYVSPDVDHERKVAIFDLIEENAFRVVGNDNGPYHLHLSLVDNRLVLQVGDRAQQPCAVYGLSLSPLRRIIKDYFLVCESYYQAIRTASPSRIEAIDMGRRSLHDEASQILMQRLEGKIEVDFDTARRLFTLICVLHWKG